MNPTRRGVWEAKVSTEYGHLVARTENSHSFSVYAIEEGKEFYCGRRFSRKELGTWLQGELTPPDEQETLRDEFGDIPAIAPNPQSWIWYYLGPWGEERLKTQYKPTTSDLQTLAGLALQINPQNFYPLGDNYEIWVCDKDTELPLFLATTGTSLAEIDKQFFSPLWRFALCHCTADTEVPLRELRDSINQRINASDTPDKVRWKHRLFRRNLDGSAVEYGQMNLVEIAEHPAGWLPTGLMAEPFESIRKSLEKL